MTRDDPRIRDAIDRLAAEGVTVTVRVDPLPNPGRASGTTDHAFVRVVATKLSTPATWLAVHCAFAAHTPGMPVHQI